MNYRLLEENAEGFVTHIFNSPHQPKFPYHNLLHTKLVAEHAAELSGFYSLNETEKCIVMIAAWFHDAGQLYGPMDDHELRGVVIMNNYLAGVGASAALIEAAGKCILVTKRQALAESLLEKIMCDADTWHFGTPYFQETDFLVREEMEIRTGKKFVHWHEASLQLLKNHIFYTEYCQLLLNQGKKENIAWLEMLIAGNNNEKE